MKAKPPEGSQGISVARNALKPFANLTELEYLAKPLLTDAAYGYYASGAEGEHTLRDNEAAFARWRLLPRVLVDVSRVDTSCTILGRKLASPILVAPMAMQKLAHPDGELAVARACVASGTAYILSTMSTAGMDEVSAAAADQQEQQQAAAVAAVPSNEPAAASAAKPVLWFQLYVMKQREVTEAMIRQAEELGYDALMVTVDAPRLGKRDRDERNKFSLPPGLVLKNIEVLTRGAGRAQQEESGEGSAFGRHFSNLFDRDLTWDFISWLKGRTKLPVVIKGILSPNDARHAVQLGVDAIIVSNHGGRQLDHSPAAVDVLLHIARAVQGRIPILVDGGIRRGTDVVKCLALGASAVCLGRPVLWALALGGQQGVQSALELLKYEVELAMALLGCRSIAEVTADFIVPPRGGELQLPQSRL